jgi:hypothetical protein
MGGSSTTPREINGATLTWTLGEAHNNAEAIVKELGPAAGHFNPKDAPLLMEAIARMSDPGFKLDPVSAYHNTPQGLRLRGKLLADFEVLSVKTRRVNSEVGLIPGAPVNDLRSESKLEVVVRRGGVTKTILISPGDTTRGGDIASAVDSDARITDPIGFAIYLGQTARAA